MLEVTTVAQAHALISTLPRPLGFVPTMGALHDGHLELVARARSRCRAVVASIFVNRLQFGANEDLAKYPRDLARDARQLEDAGVDLLFAPDDATMYPPGFATSVDVGRLGTGFEGERRPGHFRGVATVMTKLLNIVRPEWLFLGQKDAQQATLLRRMLVDLDFPTALEIVPTVRESDGLAMSSRNRYLDPEQRSAAPSLYRALIAIRDAFERGMAKGEAIRLTAAALDPRAQLEYFDVVDAQTFDPLDEWKPPLYVIGAVRIGTTRIIDNLWVPG